jgi:hypothetical protein
MGIRVFISYSHDSQEHIDRMWDLSERLRSDGIDCRIDLQEQSPDVGWPNWCERQVRQSEFVLVASTETYLRRYQGDEQTGVGRGVNWEGFVITQALYESEGKNRKFIPVIFEAGDRRHIPSVLGSYTCYDLSDSQGYNKLFRRLTDQPERRAIPVAGEIRKMLAREGKREEKDDSSAVRSSLRPMPVVERKQGGLAVLSIFEGEGRPFAGQVLIRVHNGQDVSPTGDYRNGPNVPIMVPFHDGPGDWYAVNVSADGYRDSGCFFKADPKVLAQPAVLLLHNSTKPQFAPWAEFKAGHPEAAAFLAVGDTEASAQAHYDAFSRSAPDSLACLLNLTQAMAEIALGGRTPLSYFKQVCWDNTMTQDRFFGYVDPAIIPIVRAAAAKGEFAEQKGCATFHPGSTCSWKQVAFPIANVQLTFYEHDKKVIDGVTCVKIEPDIDLYRELLAHGLGEVFPNLLSHGLTNPYAVFSLRWTTAEDRHRPAFDPGYEVA